MFVHQKAIQERRRQNCSVPFGRGELVIDMQRILGVIRVIEDHQALRAV
jgi:hypothetical protein